MSGLVLRAFLLVTSAVYVSLYLNVPSVWAKDLLGRAGACGASEASRRFVEPPDVFVWQLPRNSNGDHELVLAVHRDGDKFCYRYRLNGIDESVQPTLRVHRGERFAVRIVNDIVSRSLGERLPSNEIPPCMPMAMAKMRPAARLGYLNHVIYDRPMSMKPTDTNIHFHGFEGPAEEENVFLSTLSTPMHACEYRLTIPPTQPPGTYFYHAHAHGMSEDQVSGGLSGMWIVEPDGPPQLPRSDEHVVVVRYAVPYIDDNRFAPSRRPLLRLATADAGSERSIGPVTYDPFNPPNWPSTLPVAATGVSLNLNGCDGTFPSPLVTINRASVPVTLSVPAGRLQLLRVLNATGDSFKSFRLRDAEGRNVPLEVVARDGLPISGDAAHALSRYALTNSLVLPPAGRADLLLRTEPGEPLTLYSDHMCLGPFDEYTMKHDLIVIRGEPVIGSAPDPIVSKPVDSDAPASKLIAYLQTHPHVVRKRAITFTAHLFPATKMMRAHVGLFITDTTNQNFHEHPFWPVYHGMENVPANPDIVVKQGTIEEWYLFNATLVSHAFHIHQMAFAVESDPSGGPVMLDTVFVPSGKILPNPANPAFPLVHPTLVKVVLDFRHVPRGTFVFHCHMLFHEDHGMMGTIRVV